jgi:hypothetical protein
MTMPSSSLSASAAVRVSVLESVKLLVFLFSKDWRLYDMCAIFGGQLRACDHVRRGETEREREREREKIWVCSREEKRTR